MEASGLRLVGFDLVASSRAREADDPRRVLAGCYDDFSVDEKVLVVSGFDNAPQIAIAELFHGPTFCFKDLGLRVLVRLLSHSASRRGDRKTLLVATTGDTARALRAAADVDDPHLRVASFPRAWSRAPTAADDDAPSASVRVATFQGGGDDMDAPPRDGDGRRLPAPRPLRHQQLQHLPPLAQMVHYVWTRLLLPEQFAAVPTSSPTSSCRTGAMGNLAAATLCKRRGLPLGALCAATNVNDIGHRAISRRLLARACDAEDAQRRDQHPDAVQLRARPLLRGSATRARSPSIARDAGDLQLDADTLAALKTRALYRAARRRRQFEAPDGFTRRAATWRPPPGGRRRRRR